MPQGFAECCVGLSTAVRSSHCSVAKSCPDLGMRAFGHSQTVTSDSAPIFGACRRSCCLTFVKQQLVDILSAVCVGCLCTVSWLLTVGEIHEWWVFKEWFDFKHRDTREINRNGPGIKLMRITESGNLICFSLSTLRDIYNIYCCQSISISDQNK